ncbi:hypothetical protein LFT45_05860 [Arthrobacter sp. FW305-BF8]|nr:hypothetical protein [Arthrobacter sp. FW305-BF8]UKA55446.1 hypothetical protein LFT45_05860 [Arthrobacter sp. FW305-BF8]
MLWNTLNLFFISRTDGNSALGEAGANTDFPQGQLTSAAWEGWWDSAAQA